MTAKTPFTFRRSKGKKFMDHKRPRAKGRAQGAAEVKKLREGERTTLVVQHCSVLPREAELQVVNHRFMHKGLCTKRALLLYCLYCSSYSDIRNAASVALDNMMIEQDWD